MKVQQYRLFAGRTRSTKDHAYGAAQVPCVARECREGAGPRLGAHHNHRVLKYGDGGQIKGAYCHDLNTLFFVFIVQIQQYTKRNCF